MNMITTLPPHYHRILVITPIQPMHLPNLLHLLRLPHTPTLMLPLLPITSTNYLPYTSFAPPAPPGRYPSRHLEAEPISRGHGFTSSSSLYTNQLYDVSGHKKVNNQSRVQGRASILEYQAIVDDLRKPHTSKTSTNPTPTNITPASSSHDTRAQDDPSAERTMSRSSSHSLTLPHP
ncbi:hypothetical protein K435DRAFT_876439 [Dendrothele bispora CBS 962.96]|uniref:Uncharacterized protein n=1 Tax=Dendrothele bispora (strain CBS 962.96) TaxID=1314807 RepID=A0A4S8KS69_DENBC|nr:hypothetical protein K435DRAFT_876439 [Dendrothele bispora CBS 962.96]